MRAFVLGDTEKKAKEKRTKNEEGRRNNQFYIYKLPSDRPSGCYAIACMYILINVSTLF